jgi:hypothetical protein
MSIDLIIAVGEVRTAEVPPPASMALHDPDMLPAHQRDLTFRLSSSNASFRAA